MLAIKKENFLLGIDDIDAQHMKIIEYIDVLRESIGKKDFDIKVQKVLDFLRLYSECHFAYEEKILAHYHYPYLQEHIELHHAFIEKINVLQAEIDAKNNVMAVEVIVFLRGWLIEHIHVEDRKYMAFLKQVAYTATPFE